MIGSAGQVNLKFMPTQCNTQVDLRLALSGTFEHLPKQLLSVLECQGTTPPRGTTRSNPITMVVATPTSHGMWRFLRQKGYCGGAMVQDGLPTSSAESQCSAPPTTAARASRCALRALREPSAPSTNLVTTHTSPPWNRATAATAVGGLYRRGSAWNAARDVPSQKPRAKQSLWISFTWRIVPLRHGMPPG